MIWKIIGDFDNNFDKIIEKISKHFKIIYINNTLYISLIDVIDEKQVNEILKQIFKPAKNYFIKRITEKNILQESDEVIDWCKNNFVEHDRKRYEIENQKKLKKTLLALNEMDEILHEKFIEAFNTKGKENEINGRNHNQA